MGFLDKAKAAAEQAATKANETVADVQTKRELTRAYGDLGEKTFTLASSGAITHPDLTADVERIRSLQAKLAEDDAGAAESGPSDAAGAGSAAAAPDASAPPGGSGS